MMFGGSYTKAPANYPPNLSIRKKFWFFSSTLLVCFMIHLLEGWSEYHTRLLKVISAPPGNFFYTDSNIKEDIKNQVFKIGI